MGGFLPWKGRGVLFLLPFIFIVVIAILFFPSMFKLEPKLDFEYSYSGLVPRGGVSLVYLSLRNSGSGTLRDVHLSVDMLPPGWNVLSVKPNVTSIPSGSRVPCEIVLNVSNQASTGNKSFRVLIKPGNTGAKWFMVNVTVFPMDFAQRYLNGFLVNLPLNWEFKQAGTFFKGQVASFNRNLSIYYQLEFESWSGSKYNSLDEYIQGKFESLREEMGELKYSLLRETSVNKHRAKIYTVMFREKGLIGYMVFWICDFTDRAATLFILTGAKLNPYLYIQMVPLLPRFLEVKCHTEYVHPVTGDSFLIPIYWNNTLEKNAALMTGNNTLTFKFYNPFMFTFQFFHVEKEKLKTNVSLHGFFVEWLKESLNTLREKGFNLTKSLGGPYEFQTMDRDRVLYTMVTLRDKGGEYYNYFFFTWFNRRVNCVYKAYFIALRVSPQEPRSVLYMLEAIISRVKSTPWQR